MTGTSLEPKDEGRFDVIVVGAGAAGSCAAIAAARMGARTALIQNRPVLGGSSSIELGVGISGAGTRRVNSRESGIIEEAGRIRARFDFPKMSEPFRLLAEKEESLTVFVNRHVFAVEMSDEKTIAAVRAMDTLTGEISIYRATQFLDCTGDGWVGFYAGAKLDDPAGLLEGSGAKLRHVKVRSVEAVDDDAIRGLLEAALAERRAALGR